MTSLKYSILLLFIVTIISSKQSLAQDITVYRSTLSLDSTITKINTSIEANNYHYLNMIEFEAVSDSSSRFSGTVKVIHFDTPQIYKLAACEPSAMIDMPLKIILWSEGEDVYFGFMNANTYKKRFMIRDCDNLIREINKTLIRVANDVIRTR